MKNKHDFTESASIDALSFLSSCFSHPFAQPIHAISSSKDKNSSRKFANIACLIYALRAQFDERPNFLRSLFFFAKNFHIPSCNLLFGKACSARKRPKLKYAPSAQAVKLIRSVLIHGICAFEDGIGVARRRPYRASSLTNSTSDCAVLLATPGAQSAVARLSADLDCRKPVCRSLLATN